VGQVHVLASEAVGVSKPLQETSSYTTSGLSHPNLETKFPVGESAKSKWALYSKLLMPDAHHSPPAGQRFVTMTVMVWPAEAPFPAGLDPVVVSL
jgi:hypothetical protein